VARAPGFTGIETSFNPGICTSFGTGINTGINIGINTGNGTGGRSGAAFSRRSCVKPAIFARTGSPR
jgi:hypothetical protein